MYLQKFIPQEVSVNGNTRKIYYTRERLIFQGNWMKIFELKKKKIYEKRTKRELSKAI